MNRKPFTPSQVKLLLENRLQYPSRKLAEMLGCSRGKLQSYFRRNNLKLPKEISEKFRIEALTGRTTFTAEQSEFIKANFLKMPVKTIAAAIGKSGTGVNVRMRQLGLVIPLEIIEQRKKESQFSKGKISHNKGKKQSQYMSAEMIARTKETRFKKGRLPHNTAKKDGVVHIRKDTKTGIAYKYVRVSLGNWELYQRYLWEQENGPIPAGNVVRFKDGNSLNCSLENLEMITLAENLNRNWHDYPQPLKTAIKLINKIQKQL